MSEGCYNIPQGYFCDAQEIQRSRFITHITRATTRVEALAFVESIRKEHPRATHNCWAYVAGAPGSDRDVGMSDDGEPHGTAGAPMLQVLLHCEVGEIVAVVTRYFGGIKLGTGGLVRAYSGCLSSALEKLPLARFEPSIELQLHCPYPAEALLRRLLEQRLCRILENDYSETVSLRVHVPLKDNETLNDELRERIPGIEIMGENE